MLWLAVIVPIVLVAISQEVFYETHRRRYGLWRSALKRHFWASPTERVLMWRATTRRDPDGRVEAARLAFIGVFVLWLVAGMFVFATRRSAGW
jgi:hypothetical protein